MDERSFEATARVLDRKAYGERYRNAQRPATEKYGWGHGLPVEITPDRAEFGSQGRSPSRA